VSGLAQPVTPCLELARRQVMFAKFIGLIPLVIVVSVMGHPGGLNGEGCHNDRKGGTGFHCHSQTQSSKSRAGPESPVQRNGGNSTADERSSAQRASFVRMNPCPSTGRTKGSCPGYHVDHIKPLACGGADHPSNMQWLRADMNLRKGSMGCRRAS
jgi:hypothetical protein